MVQKSEKVSIKPLSDRVLLQEITTKDTKTASGIIIPDSANSEKGAKKGKVIAVGEGRIVDGVLNKPAVKINDVVLYSWGEEITVNNEKYIIVGMDNIMAIIN